MGVVGIAVSRGVRDDNLAKYPGKLTCYVVITLMAAAMGGLIFGYDIGISGGVTSMAPFLEKFFPSVYHKQMDDTSTNQYCKFDSQILTLFTSSLYLAALAASFFASTVTKKFGRRKSMLFGGIIFLVGAIINAAAVHIRERKRKQKHCSKRIRGVDNVDAEFSDILAAKNEARLVQNPWQNILKRWCYRPQLVMSILIPFFQQLTGINVVMFYAPVLFKTIGFGSNASLMSAVISGIVNVVATLVSVAYADKWGRRILFLEGGVQMLIFQNAVAALIGAKFGVTGDMTSLPKWFAIVVMICIWVYVAGFAWSWGPLGWLYPSEIFSLEVRSAGQSINVAVNMFFTFLIAQVFLSMLCTMKFGLFIFFAFFVVLMTIFSYFFMPETKNIPIEKMTQVWRDHWFWKRYMNDPNDPVNKALELNTTEQI
ncbi:unnamed protein product [Fraxinus pennsylvanica]|uniref:Major facilitator superfamily (MFS) profile domain-containing protein n=1 Tax=Fraxinus pennsylvanica TaxID=56036 RepID=A0AAD2A9A6_9LAMI|nr:unnamed protein product [Fraxinus pennsylvanica]